LGDREREIREGDISGGSAAVGEDTDAGDVGEGFFFYVFLEPKQRGSNFWVSSFSNFEFRLMGRKSLRKPYGYGKIS
jgi:hypothetical protein